MAQVILLRGVNVGGHRTFRPTKLAEQLKHLDVINIGTAGTFVIRKPISRTQLQAELSRILPFSATIIICEGKEIVKLMSDKIFSRYPERPDVVRFVSILSKNPRLTPVLPMHFPTSGRWLLKILGRKNKFVFGMYRRHMKVIGYLGELDHVYGVSVTTRNWNTITSIVKVLNNETASD